MFQFMNDYSVCFDPTEYQGNSIRTSNVKGRFNRANFEANRQFTDLDKIKESLQSMELWDVPCIRDKYVEPVDEEDFKSDDPE